MAALILTMGKHGRALARGWPLTLFPLLFAGFSNPAQALGVGEPQLLSGYAEPLRVRVPVSLDIGEERAGAESVHADLIPEGDYSHYGVAEQGIDLSTIFAASRTDGSRIWVEIGSNQPMREPVAILLLRVRLGNTLIVKEVPLLFDLRAPEPPAEPPAADETAIAMSTVPVTPPAAAAPASTGGIAAVARRNGHRAHRRAAAAAPAPAAAPAAAAPPMFQLSPGLRYTSASAGLRLAERFDSLADWQNAHPQAETPAAAPAEPQPAAAMQPAAPAPQPRLPAPVPAAAPAQDAAPRPLQGSGDHDWIAWLIGAALALAALFVLRRRRRERPEPAPQFIATSASAPVAAVSSPAPEPVEDQAAAPIRERLRKLSRASLDQDMARRALLVDAFLDLKRYDSAERLLTELEQDLANSGEPRPGVATVAAAVRR